MLTPSMGRITGSIYNPLTGKTEYVEHNVGIMSCRRVNNQLLKRNVFLPLPLSEQKYDPLKDIYSEYVANFGTYPVHFKEVKNEHTKL